MLTKVQHFSVNMKAAHKIWRKSMNVYEKNQILKKCLF